MNDDETLLPPAFRPPSHDEAAEKRDLIERTIQALQPQTVVIKAAETPTPQRDEPELTVGGNPPWALQQFFNGEIDLDVELATRFQRMPVMSKISFRGLGTKNERGVATLGTQDSAAQVIFEADATTRVVQMAFTYGSMLTLRFALRDLSDVDRGRWLELMHREHGGLAFLWGANRWNSDYAICIARRYYTNFYAFSPHNFEAAVRLTPDVTRQLLRWLEGFWRDKTLDEPNPPPPLLTW